MPDAPETTECSSISAGDLDFTAGNDGKFAAGSLQNYLRQFGVPMGEMLQPDAGDFWNAPVCMRRQSCSTGCIATMSGELSSTDDDANCLRGDCIKINFENCLREDCTNINFKKNRLDVEHR